MNAPQASFVLRRLNQINGESMPPATAARPSVLRRVLMSPLMDGNRRARTPSIGIEITKAAIAGKHMRHALFHRAILAIPINLPATDFDNRTPRCVSERMRRRYLETQRRHGAGCRNQEFRGGFHHRTLGCRARNGNADPRSRLRRQNDPPCRRNSPPIEPNLTASLPQIDPQVDPYGPVR